MDHNGKQDYLQISKIRMDQNWRGASFAHPKMETDLVCFIHNTLCTIIIPWGEYHYNNLPMGVSNS